MRFFRSATPRKRAIQRVTRHFAGSYIATVAGPGRAFVRSTVIVFFGTGRAAPCPVPRPQE